MKKLLKYLMMLLIATFSLTLTACGDDDEPDNPNNPPASENSDIVKGTVGYGNAFYLFVHSGAGCDIWLNNNNTITVGGFNIENRSIVYVGNVTGLKDIKTAPSTGWSESAELHDKGGYIVSYVYGGVAYYVRLMLTTNKDATGKVVGVSYALQYFTPSNV